MKKYAALALLVAGLSNVSLAAHSPVELENTEAKPRATLTINMDKLTAGVNYDLSCVIRSDRYSGKGHSDVLVQPQGGIKVFLGGVDTSLNNGVGTLRAPLNSLIAHGVTRGNNIFIRNLDKLDTIFVERCVAVPLAG